MTDEDRAYLKRSAQDLSDISEQQLARIRRDFAEADRRATEIRTGTRNALR